jgi:hypothetical protein
MTRGALAVLVAAVVVCLLIGAAVVLVVVGLPRGGGAAKTAPAPVATASPGADAQPAMLGRKIKARLYYLSADGTRLTAVEREVVYGEGPAAQAQLIINAQLAPVAAPLVSAVPAGTTLRALYLNAKGEAYVDLSRDVVTGHTGGSLDELLTIYTVVNALTANLPAVRSVQVLVDGKEVDTLAGHVDLRRPLAKNLALVEQ